MESLDTRESTGVLGRNSVMRACEGDGVLRALLGTGDDCKVSVECFEGVERFSCGLLSISSCLAVVTRRILQQMSTYNDSND